MQSDCIVVTGASRGIGLEIAARALLEGHRVAAFARHVDSEGLKNLKTRYPERLETYALDVSSSSAGETMRECLKAWDKVDVLFNNAGMYADGESQDDFIESFKTNSIAPLLIFKALLPKLQRSAFPKVINTSSLMGLVGDNASGGALAYRASKSALNMIVKCLAIDYPQVTSIVIHPGWVKTEMGGSNAPTEIKDSVKGIWEVQTQLKKTDSGKFFDFKGRQLPW